MIWLIGDKGMLGRELSGVLYSHGTGYIGSDREVDIRDPTALRAFADGKAIEWIVNCSAFTAVEKAEDEEELAFSINASGAANIAALASEIKAKLIHISTDYVFRGDGRVPYRESDPMDPAGAYGRTKAEGERLVARACPGSIIIRTAWLYGKYGPNFVFTMLRLMNEKESINVVTDQKGSPTWAFDLAEVIAQILSSAARKSGVYHFTNEGQTNWHEFAVEIQRLGLERGILKKECVINPITSDQYPAKVKRPAWSVLSKEKIRKEFGIEPPEWKDSLKLFLSSLDTVPET
jgi:dTDP-4-dehydrorhamnose reductase